MLPGDHEPQHMDQDAFVALAEKIVRARGSARDTILQPGGLEYVDALLRIRTRFNGLDLEIERKPIHDERFPHLRVSNPTTMVADGRIIRHHGEHCHLTRRMLELAAEIDAEEEASAR